MNIENLENIDRKELDQFASSVLINISLIHVAAIAAVLTIDTANNLISPVPFAIGLISAVLCQLLWFADSTFSYAYGDAEDELNKRIGLILNVVILMLGYTSIGCVIYGCLLLIKFNCVISFIISLILNN